jgi:formylglycine-generating enzyme required for sulfatase activity
VGIKKPNDLGLFDLHGNVYTWCQETYRSDYAREKNGEAIEDKEDNYSIDIQDSRALRGGSYNSHASIVRSAHRDAVEPALRGYSSGFRPARTYR